MRGKGMNFVADQKDLIAEPCKCFGDSFCTIHFHMNLSVFNTSDGGVDFVLGVSGKERINLESDFAWSLVPSFFFRLNCLSTPTFFFSLSME